MKSALPAVSLEGVAFWTPYLPDWDIASAVMRGERPQPQERAARPQPALLAPTERRRAPDSVAIALEVAVRACEAARCAPAQLPAVFASTYGDLAISDYMCATLASAPMQLSPTKFHNSVHNAAAGYWSIGTSSFAPYTALSAFRYTFGTGLLEAVSQVACEQSPVLYVAFDVEAKGPMATVVASRGLLGAALVIGPQASGRRQRVLELEVLPGSEADCSPATSAAADLLAENALAPCLPFFEALARQQPGVVMLALGAEVLLQVRLGGGD